MCCDVGLCRFLALFFFPWLTAGGTGAAVLLAVGLIGAAPLKAGFHTAFLPPYDCLAKGDVHAGCS